MLPRWQSDRQAKVSAFMDNLLGEIRSFQERFHGERYWERPVERSERSDRSDR